MTDLPQSPGRPPTGPRGALRSGVARAMVTAVVLTLAAACADAPDVPLGADGKPDPVLVQGRDIFAGQCAQCHGAAGQGGRGKKLKDGAAEERYPEIADMIAVVAEGKGSGMPAFAAKLQPAEIDAVVRYVREVL